MASPVFQKYVENGKNRCYPELGNMVGEMLDQDKMVDILDLCGKWWGEPVSRYAGAGNPDLALNLDPPLDRQMVDGDKIVDGSDPGGN